MSISCNGGKNQPLPAEQRPIIVLLNYRKEKKRKKKLRFFSPNLLQVIYKGTRSFTST